MIYQGETITLSGKFREVGKTDYINLNLYKIVARVTCPKANEPLYTDGNKKTYNALTFSTDSTDGNLKITLSDDYTYTFAIPGVCTKHMIGECTCEIAWIDKTTLKPILSDKKVLFTVNPSILGRSLV
jgi:hypothetical protein